MHDHQHIVMRINAKRRNPAWLLKLAQWIGKLRTDRLRKRELKAQGFSDKAIRGLLG